MTDHITLPREVIERAVEAMSAALSDDQPYLYECRTAIADLRTAIALHDLAAADRAAGLDYASAETCPYIRSSGEGRR